MPYLIDSDVLIQAKNLHYGLDFCPAFWDWLVAENGAGRLYSIERVQAEVRAGADDLADWVTARPDGFFVPAGAETEHSLRAVSAWVATSRYSPAAVAEFLGGADYYLVAQGLALGYTVVTQEQSAPMGKKVKIPDACAGVRVACVDTFQMLRDSGARFVMAR